MWREVDPDLAIAKARDLAWASITVPLMVALCDLFLQIGPICLLVNLVLQIVWSVRMNNIQRLRKKAKEKIRMIVPATTCYDIDLSIALNGVTTVRDTGYVWVENSMFCFEGTRVSFKLPNTMSALGTRWHKSGAFIISFLAQPDVEAELWLAGERGTAVADAVATWVREPPGREIGIGVPMEIDPESPAPHLMMRPLLLAVIASIVVPLCLWAVFRNSRVGSAEVVVEGVIFLILVICCFFALRSSRKAHRMSEFVSSRMIRT